MEYSASGALKSSTTTSKSKSKNKCTQGKHFFSKIAGVANYLSILLTTWVWVIALIIIAVIVIYISSQKSKQGANENRMRSIFGNTELSSKEETYSKNPEFSSVQSLVDNGNNEYVATKTTGKLQHYYVCSSHDSCCVGDFLNSFVSIKALQSVIRQGVRVLDFSIYLIEPTTGEYKAVVAAGPDDSTNIKGTYNHLELDDVFSTIAKRAFSQSYVHNNNDPLFIHLRIMSKKNKGKNVYNSIYDKFKSQIIDNNTPVMKKSDLDVSLGNTDLSKYNNKITLLVSDLNDNKSQAPKEFQQYICGYYGKPNVLQPEFSVMKNKDVSQHPDVESLKIKNMKSITLTTNDNLPTNENMNPNSHIQYGCHMICMNWQNFDSNLEFFIEFFKHQGKGKNRWSSAFRLKRDNLRNGVVTYSKGTKVDKEAISSKPKSTEGPAGISITDMN